MFDVKVGACEMWRLLVDDAVTSSGCQDVLIRYFRYYRQCRLNFVLVEKNAAGPEGGRRADRKCGRGIGSEWSYPAGRGAGEATRLEAGIAQATDACACGRSHRAKAD